MNNVSYAEKEYAKLSPVGNFVLLKKLEQEAIRKVDGIYIPETEHFANAKMGCGQVLELKEELSEEYGVKAGDYVLYDFYSAHGDHKDTVITDVDNLIAVLTEEEADKFVKGEQ